VTESFSLNFDNNDAAFLPGIDPDHPNSRLVYKFIGLPTKRVVETTGQDFVRTQTTNLKYELVGTNGGLSYYTRPTSLDEKTEETKNAVTTVLSTRHQDFTPHPGMDNFGVGPDVTTTITTDQGTYVDSVASQFENFPDQWLLGLETDRVVTSKTPLGGEATRHTTFQPDPNTGVVFNTTVEPEDLTNDKYLFVEFIRNQDGTTHIVRQTDHLANVRVDTIDYDSQAVHPTKYTNSLGQVTTLGVDAGLGVVQSIKDPNNVTRTFDYDGFGRIRRENFPGGGGVSYTYARDIEPGSTLVEQRFVTKMTTLVDGGGESHVVTNRLGQEISREVKNLDASFSSVTKSYSALGLVNSVTRPAKLGTAAGPATSLSFDVLGRLLSRTRPEDGRDVNDVPISSVSSSKVYDGAVQTSTDDFGRLTVETVDPFGRTVKQTAVNDAGQAVRTSFTFGPFGVLRFVNREDGNGSTDVRETVAEYDNLGRQTLLDDVGTGKRQTQYNAFGEIREETDAKGLKTTLIRDVLGRVNERDDNDGKTTFTWDTAANGKGKLAETMSASGVRRQFFYDTSGRLNREIWTMVGQTFQVDYSFDSFGKVSKVSYPNVSGFSRLVVRNVYSPNSGELSKVQNDSSSFTYWELKQTKVDGMVGEEVFGNKVVTDYAYSGQTGRLASIQTVLPGSTPKTLRSWSYDFWSDGNLRRQSDVKANHHERFEYDAMDRVKNWLAADATGKAVSGGWKVNYTLDDFGNLTRRKFSPGTTTGGTAQDVTFALLPGTDRVQSSSLSTGTYSYDANGNQTGRPGGETVTYTAFNLPKTMTGPQPATFLYEAGGMRAKKRKTDTDYTLYVGGLYEKRLSGSSTDHVFSLYADDRVVAQVTRHEGTSGDKVLYLHGDRLGSIDTVTDSTGTPTQNTRRDPFGNNVSNFNQPTLPTSIAASSNKVRLGFTSQEQDDELGLINMRGRVYDPRLGRFLTPDPYLQAPFVPQNYNRYSYVINNPLKYTDPSGHFFCRESGCYESDGAGGLWRVTDSEKGADGKWTVKGSKDDVVVTVHPDDGDKVEGPQDHGGNGNSRPGGNGGNGNGGSNRSPDPNKKAPCCGNTGPVGNAAPASGQGAGTNPLNYRLEFNGRSLMLLRDWQPGEDFDETTALTGRVQVGTWRAVSGRSGYQTAEFQGLRNIGPVPEGTYRIRQSAMQTMSEIDDMIGTLSVVLPGKHGAWPGGSYAWGVERIPLEPLPGTDTRGRNNMLIHGGDAFGSAGCIDLAGGMHSFSWAFRDAKVDMNLTVRYDK
jgi:RHS repeat-associated protein